MGTSMQTHMYTCNSCKWAASAATAGFKIMAGRGETGTHILPYATFCVSWFVTVLFFYYYFILTFTHTLTLTPPSPVPCRRLEICPMTIPSYHYKLVSSFLPSHSTFPSFL